MRPTWLSGDNVKWLIATLAIPVTLGLLSYQYEKASTARQATEARLRLYTELLSKREEMDTGVRRGIFDKVLETYLKPGGADVEQKLVALELLALNFHDSLNLSPLFWQLEREIGRSSTSTARKGALTDQLGRIAREIKDRQVEVLEVVGAKRDGSILFEGVGQNPVLFDEELVFRDPDPLGKDRELKRHFKVEVVEHDAARHRVLVRVYTGKSHWVLWIDPFDLPFVDFLRLSTSERFAAVLRTYRPESAQITFIYFPSSRSGVKDKPFMDEVLSDLRRDAR
jgi:hypothetical protein